MDPQQDPTQNAVPPAPDDAGLGNDNTNAPAPQTGDTGVTPPADSGLGASTAPEPPAAPTVPTEEDTGVSGVATPADEQTGLPPQPAVGGEQAGPAPEQEETSPGQPPQNPQPPIAPSV